MRRSISHSLHLRFSLCFRAVGPRSMSIVCSPVLCLWSSWNINAHHFDIVLHYERKTQKLLAIPSAPAMGALSVASDFHFHCWSGRRHLRRHIQNIWYRKFVCFQRHLRCYFWTCQWNNLRRVHVLCVGPRSADNCHDARTCTWV